MKTLTILEYFSLRQEHTSHLKKYKKKNKKIVFKEDLCNKLCKLIECL